MTDPKSLQCCKQRATGDLAVGKRMAEARWGGLTVSGWGGDTSTEHRQFA